LASPGTGPDRGWPDYTGSHGSWTAEGGPKTIGVELARKILAVSTADADGGSNIAAAPTRALITRLVKRGWSKAELARRITGNPNTASLQMNGKRVRARTARRVEEIYQELRDLRPPPRGTRYDEWAEPGPEPREGIGRCKGCGEPLATHDLQKRCAPSPREAAL